MVLELPLNQLWDSVMLTVNTDPNPASASNMQQPLPFHLCALEIASVSLIVIKMGKCLVLEYCIC